MSSDASRLAAVKILTSLTENRGSLSSLLEKHGEELSAEKKALVQAICYGVCRQYFQLDNLIRHFLQKPLRRKDQDIFCLLLIGAYQLLFMRMPDYAVLNECVDTCKRLKKVWAKNLVNAILRSVQREGLALIKQANNDLSLHFSHPQWIIKQLQKDWPQDYPEILEANNQQAPMTLRINQSKITRPEYLALLQDKTIDAKAGELSPTSIYLNAPLDVNSLPGFKEGLVSVQDEASQLCADLLQAQNDEKVLDACAAPGGKTCAILEAAPLLTLYAVDNDPQRIQRIEENLQRIRAKAELFCQDIQNQALDWQEQLLHFDRILLDVPCTASGVIRRHPDIKILRHPEDLEKLIRIQQEIIEKTWPLLKQGGLMLYSTCSLFKAENSEQISFFLKNNPDAQEIAIPGLWGVNDKHGRQLFPVENSHDGFYYALLQKC